MLDMFLVLGLPGILEPPQKRRFQQVSYPGTFSPRYEASNAGAQLMTRSQSYVGATFEFTTTYVQRQH
jgi:hypothetical protein